MAYHNIRSKIERALVAWLRQQLPAFSGLFLPAKSSADKDLPIVACHCSRAVVDPPYSSNFTCEVDVSVRSTGFVDSDQTEEDPRIDSDTIVRAVFDEFQRVDSSGYALGEAITTAARALAVSDPTGNGDLANLTVLNVRPVSEEGGFIAEGAAWEDSLTLEVAAVPFNVS